jgi:hypothetical protein
MDNRVLTVLYLAMLCNSICVVYQPGSNRHVVPNHDAVPLILFHNGSCLLIVTNVEREVGRFLNHILFTISSVAEQTV